jgi:hypothetical protein
MAVDEYHTSTSVLSDAGRPSTGAYCENPVSSEAVFHTGSDSEPSTTMLVSMRRAMTSSRALRPSTIRVSCAGAS